MANSVTFSSGLVLMSVYALGFSALFLAVGLGLLNLRKLPKAGKWMVWVHRLSTVLLLFAGIFYIFRGAGFIST
jgi:thiol:disulfide interchange protein